MSTSNTAFRFDVDGEPLFLALQRTQAKLKDLGKEYVNLGRNTKMTSDQIAAEQMKLITMFVKEEQTYERLIAQRKRMAIETTASNTAVTRSTNMASGAMSKYGMMIGQVSFAVDDFVTVAQLQNWSLDGVIGGLRAAANNFGMVLYAIHPLLAIVPSLATAIGGPLLKAMFGGGASAKELAEQTERANKALAELSKKAQEIRIGSQAVQDLEEDAKFSVAVRDQSKIVAAKQQELDDFKLTFDPKTQHMGDWEKSVNQADEERKAILAGQVADEKKKLQKIKDDNELRIKTRNEQQQADAAIADQRQSLEGLAQSFASQGMNQEDIFLALQGNADLPYSGATQGHLQGIAKDAVNNHRGQFKPPETEAMGRLRLKQKEKSALEEEKTQAELARPHGKLPKRESEEFERRNKELQLEIAELQKKIDKQNSEMLEATKKQNYWLEQIANNSSRRPAPGANGNNIPPN